MVAKIRSGKSLKGALNYNEHKVSKGLAFLIAAPGFQKDAQDLTYTDKLSRLTNLAAGNQRVRTNTFHTSLNFDATECLDDERLAEITRDYMDGIGFGRQPFLVYKHTDAGHPHVHIVATNIDRDGLRISMHNLGKYQSEQARRSIEERYGLVKAEGQKNEDQQRIKPAPVVYGKTDTKRAISNLVNEVSRTYKFTSLAEFNAVLTRFNVLADRGNPASVMYAKNGLRYYITDQSGTKLGVPIKASSIYGKPTMNTLFRYFQLNEVLRKPLRDNLRARIDLAIRKSIGFRDLENNLRKNDIDLVRRVNQDGKLYGLSFIDHRLRVVFNGSDIGKTYSAANLSAALGSKGSDKENKALSGTRPMGVTEPHNTFQKQGQSVLEVLLAQENQDNVPAELLIQRKKKRKRKHI